MKYTLLILLFFFISGCNPGTNIYYWGNYSSSLYNLKKEPGDESRLKHRETLEGIFKNAEKKHKKVPPGLYCEYGYILVQQGNIDEGLKYFDLEVEHYPESKPFVERLINQIKKRQE
jgi:hypothetical protein